MPKPQYNVKQTDTGSRRYNVPPVQQPKVNPLKDWWNNIVNNARQNPNTLYSNPFGVNAYSAPVATPPVYSPMPNLPVPIPKANPLKNWWNNIVNNARQNPNTLYSNPFGVNAYGVPQMPTAYGSNTRRGGTPPNRAAMPPAGKYGRGQFPQILNPDSWLVASQNPGSSYERETLAELLARGAVDPNSHDPYEIGGSPYQTGPWVRNPELPPDQGGGGWGGGGWGGWGGWGGGGGDYSYYTMPGSPRYKGYGGGYGTGGSPRSARYQGNYGGYGGGYGGYAGGQSQRSAWYGALLQWNI